MNKASKYKYAICKSFFLLILIEDKVKIDVRDDEHYVEVGVKVEARGENEAKSEIEVKGSNDVDWAALGALHSNAEFSCFLKL
ncbi:hypothetical protein L1987_34046 [Smallanthus sonchifolius]|uniref:Uncharacterized protein n=1 Tax=Smallanthus sonchifolius TaxID=185202 RepID=A0ACB9HT50_9ASTR|nr:hypothetical protein L1987_34046 [Smallanthus sonchifolius]